MVSCTRVVFTTTPERYVFFHSMRDRSRFGFFYSRAIDIFGLGNDFFSRTFLCRGYFDGIMGFWDHSRFGFSMRDRSIFLASEMTFFLGICCLNPFFQGIFLTNCSCKRSYIDFRQRVSLQNAAACVS